MWLWLLIEACKTDSDGDHPPSEIEPHNILIIVLDDVGIERLELYGVGDTWAKTPNIDALAAEGVSFRTTWAMPVCSPSRAAILTGRHAARTGFGTVNPPQFHWVMPSAEVTIPEMLESSPAAYTDAAIGKWHLGDRGGDGLSHPQQSGFSHFTGSMNNLDESWGGTSISNLDYNRWLRTTDGEIDLVERYATLETTDEAIDFIATAPEPWFLYLAYNAAHSPLTQPPPDLFSGPWHPDASDELKHRWIIEALDTEIGRLLASMDAVQRAQTTILVVGDNGTPDFAATGELTPERLKRSPFEGGLRVPLIVSSPHVRTPGTWSDALVHVTDVFSTAADIARVDLSEIIGADGLPLRIDGQSLLPYLVDPDAPSARSLLLSSFFGPNGPPPYQQGFHTIRDREFKLVRDLAGAPDQLYDLRGRVFEGEDLLAEGPLDAEQRAVYDHLATQLDEMLAAMPYEGPN